MRIDFNFAKISDHGLFESTSSISGSNETIIEESPPSYLKTNTSFFKLKALIQNGKEGDAKIYRISKLGGLQYTLVPP